MLDRKNSRLADWKCSACSTNRLCSRNSQKDLHISECDTKEPIHTGYHLARASICKVLPDDPQTCQDYGFNRAATTENRSKLLGLYTEIFRLGITPDIIHQWRVNGGLVEGINMTFEKKQEGSRGVYYTWFTENRYVFDPSLEPVSESVQFIAERCGWPQNKHRPPDLLPPELYRPIIENIYSKEDLYNLLFVSHIVSYEAERVLYRKISISIKRHHHIRTSMNLFIHISHCPRVARYVGELEISNGFTLTSLHSDPDTRYLGIQDPNHYWNFINRALCALTSVRVLKLSNWIRNDSFTPSVGPPSSIFSGCTFKLEVLKLTDYSADEIPQIDLTQVKELSLRRKYKEERIVNFRRGAFLSLQVLTSTPKQFLKLGTRNTKRVKALELCKNTPHEQMAGVFANVTSLKIHSMLDDMILHFPSLQFLQAPVGEWELNKDEHLSEMLRKLTVLEHLEILCLVTFNRLSQYQGDLHLRFFAAIHNLEALIISCDMPNSQPGQTRNGQLWKRNSSCGKSVHVSEAFFKDEWKNPRWLEGEIGKEAPKENQ